MDNRCSTQTLTSVVSLMDHLLWLYGDNTSNSAVNYLNNCQTYDKYRMQVTDQRSQVQVTVKAGGSPCLGKKTKKQNKT